MPANSNFTTLFTSQPCTLFNCQTVFIFTAIVLHLECSLSDKLFRFCPKWTTTRIRMYIKWDINLYGGCFTGKWAIICNILMITIVDLQLLFDRTHTAVKIAPNYSQPTIHVLDASKSVVVVC